MSYAIQSRDSIEQNKLYSDDTEIHDWYRFVLSYPPHLVRDYINKFKLNSKHTILDPFCGTGTTLVESKKLCIKLFESWGSRQLFIVLVEYWHRRQDFSCYRFILDI